MNKLEQQLESLRLLKKNAAAVNLIEDFIEENHKHCKQLKKTNKNFQFVVSEYKNIYNSLFTLCDSISTSHNINRDTVKLYFALDKKLFPILKVNSASLSESIPTLELRHSQNHNIARHHALNGHTITKVFRSDNETEFIEFLFEKRMNPPLMSNLRSPISLNLKVF